MSFTGRFWGECDVCGEQTKGTEVSYSLSNRIVHVVCPEVDTTPRPTCPECFLELPATGVCGDCS